MLRITSDVDVKGYTLVLPSVSVGNVGQLAVDLWISTLNCAKIGYVWHPAVMPVVGANPFATSSSIMISSEVYCDETHKLIFLQIRSPVLRKTLGDFLDKLLDWAEVSEISRVVVLTGSTYTEGKAALIVGDKLRYMFTPAMEAEGEALAKELQWTRNKEGEAGNHFLAGGGFAVMVYEKCVERKVKAAVLVKFCAEGDNIPDAHLLAGYLNAWLKVVPLRPDGRYRWVNPFSWKHLFGKFSPNMIF